jgi:hypothetical protein
VESPALSVTVGSARVVPATNAPAPVDSKSRREGLDIGASVEHEG